MHLPFHVWCKFLYMLILVRFYKNKFSLCLVVKKYERKENKILKLCMNLVQFFPYFYSDVSSQFIFILFVFHMTKHSLVSHKLHNSSTNLDHSMDSNTIKNLSGDTFVP